MYFQRLNEIKVEDGYEENGINLDRKPIKEVNDKLSRLAESTHIISTLSGSPAKLEKF